MQALKISFNFNTPDAVQKYYNVAMAVEKTVSKTSRAKLDEKGREEGGVELSYQSVCSCFLIPTRKYNDLARRNGTNTRDIRCSR